MKTDTECILCGEVPTQGAIYACEEFQVLRCASCGLIYQHLPGGADGLLRVYSNIYSAEEAEIPRGVHDFLRDMHREVTEVHPKPGAVLDIGCSYGVTTRLFVESGWQAQGIDVSEPAIRVARAQGLPCELSSVEAFVPARRYDAVVLNHVIEHVPDPVAVLSRVAGWLAPGGTVHIRVPNAAARPLRASSTLFLGDLKPFEHFCYFTPDTLGSLTTRCGLVPTIKVGRIFLLSDAVNCLVRAMVIRSRRWRAYNYGVSATEKSRYFSLRRAYGFMLGVFGHIVLSRDREIQVIARLAVSPSAAAR